LLSISGYPIVRQENSQQCDQHADNETEIDLWEEPVQRGKISAQRVNRGRLSSGDYSIPAIALITMLIGA
jgi:hypothetical protein